MKLHDPAQAESMREMLKKMRVSPEQKPAFQFTSPKPRRTRREADRSTARRGALHPWMPTRKKRSNG